VRYFIDENLLGVAKALASVRDDVCHPGHPELPEVPTGTLDERWLPTIGTGGRDLILITRDNHIRTRPAERMAFHEHGIRAFFITGKKELNAWQKLDLLVRQWEKIERAVAKNGTGPWAMSLTRGGSPKDIPLTPPEAATTVR